MKRVTDLLPRNSRKLATRSGSPADGWSSTKRPGMPTIIKAARVKAMASPTSSIGNIRRKMRKDGCIVLIFGYTTVGISASMTGNGCLRNSGRYRAGRKTGGSRLKLIKNLIIQGEMMRNRTELAKYFGELGFKTGAEIGTCYGAYAEKLYQNIPDLKLIAVDNWDNPETTRRERDRKVSVETKARAKLAPYGTIIVKKSSMEAVKKVPDE